MDQLNRLFNLTALLGATLALGTYLVVAALRLTYPFALEWIEPNFYLHVARVLAGQPLYGPPSFDYIPMIYPPLYYYLAAALAWPLQNIVLAMRLVSVGASLVSFATIYAIAYVRGLAPALRILAVGLFAATYALSGYWFDVSRVDSLLLALLLLSYLLVLDRSRVSWLHGALAGLLLCLAFFSKQSAALAFPLLLVDLLARRVWSKAMGFGLAFLVSLLISLLLANQSSAGWFWFYTVTVPGSAPIIPGLFTEFWTIHLSVLLPALMAILLCLLLLLSSYDHRRRLIDYLELIIVLGLPLLLMSLMSMIKLYGFINGLMPLTAALALMAAEAAQHVRMVVTERSHRPTAWLAGISVMLLLLGQLVMLRYDPTQVIPAQRDWRAGEALLAKLAATDEPTFASTALHLLGATSRPLHFHASSQGDLAVAAQHNPDVRARLDDYQVNLNQRLASGAFRSVLLPDVRWYDGLFGPEQGYTCQVLPPELRLGTFSGVPHTLATLCTR